MEKFEPTEKDEQKLEEEIRKKIKQTDDINERIRLHLINDNLLKKKQLDKQLEIEIEKLTKSIQEQAQPLQQEINEIITGQKQINQEDLQNIDYLTEEEKKQQIENKCLQGYWYQVIKNCDEIARDIKKKDEEPLKSLQKIEHKQEKDSKDFSLIFYFNENEYFESPCVITKKFKMKNEQEAETAQSEEIKWKEGKNVTVKITEKKQKNKKTGKTRIIKKEVPDESFFNFFKDTEMKDESDDEELEEDEQYLTIEDQLDMAQFFTDELIPYSLEYYFALRKNEEGELDDVVEENEEDEDDDEEEVQSKMKKKKQEKKKPRKKSGLSEKSDKEKKEQAEKPEKPECKQQ